MCTALLPPCGNPIAVNKYININNLLFDLRPLGLMTKPTFPENKYFVLETSAERNYLSQIFCLNTAVALKLQATDYKVTLHFIIQGNQKVSVNLTITVQTSGPQRRYDHPVQH
jgi:hypothetical protein